MMGPEDAVYCRIEDPSGSSIFEGFGRCRIDLERARFDHKGQWTMIVGSPGRVLTDEHKFIVNVMEAGLFILPLSDRTRTAFTIFKKTMSSIVLPGDRLSWYGWTSNTERQKKTLCNH